jgi:exopolysaccharide production protein ExoY
MNVNSSISSNNTYIFYEFSKRIFDILVSITALIILFPLTFVFVFPFYFFGELKGPILFKQERIGKNGEIFKIYKFRSMVVNAEEKLKNDKVLFSKYVERGYKLEPHEDPRITKFGSFLRKTSLDEIPQLINVLIGNMSLVGPRPVVNEELTEYKEKKNEFLSVKPGITGYWQVSGRSNIGYPERVDLELYYVYNKSFWFDVIIILKTVLIVLSRRGAY